MKGCGDYSSTVHAVDYVVQSPIVKARTLLKESL